MKQVQAQCTLDITRVTPSGCYYSGGQSLTTVTVEIAWTNPPAGNITVQLGALTRTITPSSFKVISPQVVAFEIPANGAAGTVNADFDNNSACNDSENFIAPAACAPSACPGGAGIIGGKAFNDYNQDGVKQSGETNGQNDVEVRIYACDPSGNSVFVNNTTTDVNGDYYFTGLTNGVKYRLEFTLGSTLLAQGYRLGNNGTDSRTSVQFVTAPACTANIGVFIPSDYCEANPRVLVPCYARGNPLVPGSAADDPALVGFLYNASGNGAKTMYADQSQVGSLWGMAYDKNRSRMYSSAFLRRHTGLGPYGLHGIYVTDMTAPPATSTSLFLDLNTLGVNLGTISSNAARGLVADKTTPNVDAEAFSKIGKVGLGDIDISENGDTLYFMNLFTGMLQSLRMDDDGNPATPYTHVVSDVDEYDFSSLITCTGGAMRPFGLKYYKGKVYIGVVCDAQASNNRANLRAYIVEFIPGANTFSILFDFPLTYPKGSPFNSVNDRPGWYPWTDTWSTITGISGNGGTQIAYPSPMLCDIEFDIDGSMVLGFGDRAAYQLGFDDYAPTGAGPLYRGFAGGDILRVFAKNGAYSLENNAKAGPTTGFGVNNNQGPGFGEFYNDVWNNGGHSEIMLGGLALRPGSGQVMAVMMDPMLNNPPIWSNGTRTMSNLTGAYVNGFVVFEYSDDPGTGTFGKSAGLGDIELVCALPSQTQIGNRIWIDSNKDGIQDPCEDPIVGVKVELYDRNGNLVGSTTTNASGEYYFDQTNVDTIAPYGSGGYTGMSPNTQYYVVVGKGMSQYNTTQDHLNIGAVYYKLTPAPNTGQAPNSDMNDSDGQLLTGLTGGLAALNAYPGVAIVSPDPGDIDHTIDFGFAEERVAVGNYVFMDNDDSGTFNAGDMAIPGVTVWLYASGANYGVDAALATDVTDPNGYYYFDDLAAGQYVVYIPASNFTAGQSLENKETVTGAEAGDTTDNNDNGQDTKVQGGIRSNTFTLTPNTEPTNESGAGGEGSGNPQYPGTLDDDNVNETIDFGFRLEKVAVGNYVFMDNDESGTFNAGDMAIPNVSVWLYPVGADYGVDVALKTTTTNAGGYYYFDSLTAGQYVVFIPASNFGAGQPLLNKNSTPGADAGEIVDNNDNGQDVLVNGGVRSNTITLNPGSEPSNESGAGGDGSGNPQYPGGLSDDNVNETIDFAFRLETVAVGNFVFMDNDDNGLFGAGDMAIPGVTVWLYAAGANYGIDVPLATDVTDANGYYYFDDLIIGQYVVYIPAINFNSGQPLENKESVPGADPGEAIDDNDNGQDAKVNGGIRSNTVTLAPDTEPINEIGTGGSGSLIPEYPGTIDDKNVNETIDFGFRLEKVAVGNYVFMDNDDSGTFNAGDMAIPGVTVHLYLQGDEYGVDLPLATDVTDGNGYYYFDNLNAGQYVVYIPASNFGAGQPLQDKESTPGADAGETVDNNDNGQDTKVNGGIRSNTVTLFPGSEPSNETGAGGDGSGNPQYPGALNDDNVNETVDFGFRLEKVAVGNYVFMDNDDSGTYNAGDMAIPNVTVWLYPAGANIGVDAPLATDVTDPSGYYYFDQLTQGQYVVFIPALNFAPGGALDDKQSVPGAEAGETVDDNDNGQDTPVNGGIRSNTFTLYPNTEPTNESGAGGSGTGTPDYNGTLDDNNVNETIDFGFRLEKVAIGNFVFMDNDDSGTFNAGDMAVPNVTVWLYPAGADYGVDVPLEMTTTNGNGYYYFDSLTAGQYVVYIPGTNFDAGNALENKQSTPGEDGGDTVDNNDNGQDTPDDGGVVSNVIDLYPNDEPTGETQTDYPGGLPDENVNSTVDFGFRVEKVAVGNYVFMDNDDSGTYNVGDMAIPNVTVWLYLAGANVGVDAPLATDITDANGYYYFDSLNAGQYVVFIPALNFAPGAALDDKQSVPGAEAGETVDNNDNGQDTPVNGGIRSNTFTLTPNSEPTNESGAGGSGTGTPAYPGGLPDNNVNETIDFGFRLEKVAIGNFVFMDNDDSGTFNAGDMAVPNVTVWLYPAGADYGVDVPLATDITDGNGYYYFDSLTAGTYVVYIPASNFGAGQPLFNKQSTPGQDTGDTDDDDDNGSDTPVNGGIPSNPITLYPNDEPTGEPGSGGDGTNNPQYPGGLDDDNVNETVDFGFRLEKVAMGSYVFMDNDDSGVFNVGDMPIQGVIVWLYPSSANIGIDLPLATDVTDPSGYYYFDSLFPGDYVAFIPAINFAPGGALEDKQSVPGADAGETVDDNDNGQDAPVNGGIRSSTFTLTPNSEPTSELGTGGSGTGTPAYPGGLPDNNVNETIDFGFRLEKVAIGNYVFMDNDDSGTFNAGDMAIPNVAVWLYPAGADYGVAVPLATDITDGNGYYYFDSLTAGTYVVYIPASNFGAGQPLFNKQSAPGQDTGDTDDDDDNGSDTPVNGGIPSNPITLYPNDEPTGEPGSGGDGTNNPQYPGGLDDDNVNETVDFGFRLEKVAVGNFVFMDNDEDGIYSVGDMPIPLVDVWLYPAGANYGVDAPLMMDITNPDGYYYFDSLYPGQYVVYIPASNFLLNAALDSKESYPGADAGNGDNNDNGLDVLVNGGVASVVVNLQPNSMPTNEPGAGGSGTGTPAYPGGLDDNNVNETVDFTFRCVNPLPDIIADITVNTEPGVCTAVVTYNVNIVTTPSNNLTVTYEFTGATTGSGNGTGSGSTFNLGETTITITATNACTTVVRVFTITVIDEEPPVITCPPNVTVQCMPTNQNATATDNCSVETVELLSMMYLDPPMMCVTGRRLVRTFIATDGSGNTATCSHQITLVDNIKPTFTFVPANVTVQCNSVPAPGTPVATDNCAGQVTIVYDGQTRTNGSCTDTYVLVRQWTASDACGNTRTATQRLTVRDTQKPAFVNPPANITVQCTNIPAVNTPVATDNCDVDVAITYVGQTKTNGSCPNAYTLTRRWVASDNCNNTVSISQRITVVDNVKPVFTSVPQNVTLNCTQAIPSVGVATASDGCGPATVVFVGAWNMNASCPGSYQIMRTWKATDACGNSTTAAQIITIQDSTPPAFTTFPNNVTIQCNQAPPTLTNPIAADGCGGYVNVTYLGQVRTNGNCLSNYILTRTWRAIDLCGNATTKAQVITVQDTQAPNFIGTLPANTTVVCAPNCIPVAPSLTATDNCGSATVTMQQSQSPGDCSTGYTVTRIWTATDACGNPKQHTQVFTVLPASNFGPANDPSPQSIRAKVPTPTQDRDQHSDVLNTQHSKLKTVTLAPNPTTDWVHIGLGDFVGETVVVSIHNELGQLIWEQRIPTVEESVLRVNLRQAGATAGLHTVSVRSGEAYVTKRLILVE